MAISLQKPETQIDFAYSLQEIRKKYLQDALSDTVIRIPITQIDSELSRFVDAKALSLLASKGMRGELLFALPCILNENPYLLGYYRLLLGYSQKAFYVAENGIGIFSSMESKGKITSKQKDSLDELCIAINENACYFLERLTTDLISAVFFDQLTILTLGPQFRGGANVQRGVSAIKDVFQVIYDIVKDCVTMSDARHIELYNSSGRKILILFASDPDIVIKEELAPNKYKNLTAIEIKGGQDYSNIHNRVGEAEKSHQKAKKDGYIECWTVVNVDRIDMAMARRESPTTSRFYRISGIADKANDEYEDFKMQIISTIGIR